MIVQSIWRSGGADGFKGLWDHPLYQSAKGARDAYSAVQIIDDLAREEAVDSLRELAVRAGRTPMLIAPSADASESNNALAISYAHWLGHELGWSVEERVFQQKSVSRDKQGAWFRLAHRASFYGEIDTSTPYVVVDDVITMGGTMADMRSFILAQGGSVIGMSAIASSDGHNKRIRLDGDTKARLELSYGPDLERNCRDLFGFPHDCFTRDEGRRVLDCADYERLRTYILRARNAGDPSRREGRT